jgi:hypothetical protein
LDYTEACLTEPLSVCLNAVLQCDAPYYSIHYEHVRMLSSYQREMTCLNTLPNELRDKGCRRNTLAWLEGRT